MDTFIPTELNHIHISSSAIQYSNCLHIPNKNTFTVHENRDLPKGS